MIIKCLAPSSIQIEGGTYSMGRLPFKTERPKYKLPKSSHLADEGPLALVELMFLCCIDIMLIMTSIWNLICLEYY